MSRGELYYPRKCFATNKVINAVDHAAIQINLGKVNAEGVYTRENVTYPISGFVRSKGESDGWVTKLAQKDGLVEPVFE